MAFICFSLRMLTQLQIYDYIKYTLTTHDRMEKGQPSSSIWSIHEKTQSDKSVQIIARRSQLCAKRFEGVSYSKYNLTHTILAIFMFIWWIVIANGKNIHSV